jgi:hypothetical protein
MRTDAESYEIQIIVNFYMRTVQEAKSQLFSASHENLFYYLKLNKNFTYQLFNIIFNEI